jgi:hypothetical protein
VGAVDLELGPDPGQRAAQLVRGVGHEPALPLRRAASRSSIAFIVRASRAISSPVAGSGTRRSSRLAEIRSTSARMSSTGRSTRPTSHQTSAARTAALTGTATSRERTRVRVLSSTSSRLPTT